jgi:hypothetical protein
LLVAKVLAAGSRIETFPKLPKDAPSWNGRVQVIPKQKKWDYQQVTTMLINECRAGNTTNIFCNGVVSNRNCADNKQIGAASAVLYHEGKDWNHTNKPFGVTATEADTMIRALTLGINILSSFLEAHPTQAHKPSFLLLPSNAAVNKALNASPHEEQETAIQHLTKLGKLLTLYPNLSIKLLWLLKMAPFIGFKRTRQLALEMIRTTDLRRVSKPHTIQSQKKDSRTAATAKWAKHWHLSPRTSFAYRTALTSPPDGRPHPTLQPSRPTPPPQHGRHKRPTHPTKQQRNHS